MRASAEHEQAGFAARAQGDELGQAAADGDAEGGPRRASLGNRVGERDRRPAAPADDEADKDAGRHLHEEGGVREDAERRAPAPVEDTRGFAHRVEERTAAVGQVVRRMELLVLERRDGVEAAIDQDGSQRFGQGRKDEAGGDQPVQGAIAEAAQAEQREADERVDEQHVARPEQHRVDEADDGEERQPARIDVRGPMPARRHAEAYRARGFGAVQTRHLDREADAEHESEEQVELAGEQDVAQRRHEAVEQAARRLRQGEHRVAEGGHVHNEDAQQREAAQNVERGDAVARGERRFGVVRGRIGVGTHVATVSQTAARPPQRPGCPSRKGIVRCSRPPSPAACPSPPWLAETEKLWPEWKSSGAELDQAKADATLLWLKVQEDAGIDVVGDGEQSRQHFVHGFLAQGRRHRLRAQGQDGHPRQPLRRDGAAGRRAVAPGRARPRARGPPGARAHRETPEVHAARADDHRRHRRRPLLWQRQEGRIKMAFAFAELLNQEARALAADGVDVVQFDEPAFNVYMADAGEWGVAALERAAEGLTCKTAVHICYGYGIKANVDWKQTLGDEWRQYEQIFPALARSRIDQVSLECYHSHVPAELMRLLDGKDVMVGVIDVASDVIETPEEVAATIESALRYVPADRLFPCTNCGLAPMRREVAEAKLAALGQGAALARARRGG